MVKRILSATAQDIAILRGLAPPVRGADAGSGTHVVIPGNWLSLCLAGTLVAGCTCPEIEPDGGITVDDAAQARLLDSSVTGPMNQTDLAAFQSKLGAVVGNVWCVGDSLTLGANSTNAQGYEAGLVAYIATHSYRATLVGSFTNSGPWGSAKHDGVSGRTTAELRDYVPSGPLSGAFPNLVIVFSGTNDMGLNQPNYDPTTLAVTYRTLLENVRARSRPKIAVLNVIPVNASAYPYGAASIADWNPRLVGVWNAWDAAHPNDTLIRVDANAALGGTWSVGMYGTAGVGQNDYHPQQAGYDAISSAVQTAVGPVLATW